MTAPELGAPPTTADPKPQLIFTTGEVARICGISIQTVIRAFDAKAIKGYLIPGSSHRRITRVGLIAFMEKHNIPLSRIDAIPEDDPILSSGQASKILGLPMQTVIRLYDSGCFQGFIVPGSKFRRILRSSLYKFMDEHGIPRPKEADPSKTPGGV